MSGPLRGEQPLRIAAGDVELEAGFVPAGLDGGGACLVCHPHPKLGGTMNHKIVTHLAKACLGAGMGVLRFNFRGVGASTGSFDDGRGEADDASHALDALLARSEGAPVVVAGYSFGSYAGLKAAAADPRVDLLIAVAPPVELFDFGFVAEALGRVLVIAGEHDPICTPKMAGELTAPRLEVVAVPGADHLFHGQGPALRAAVGAFLRG